MKLRLEATPEELEQKSGKLLKALSDIIAPANPDLAEYLEKALPRKEPVLKFPVLRELQKRTTALYEKQMKAMVAAIGKVLDRSVQKSLEKADKTPLTTPAQDHTKAIVDKEDIAYTRAKQVLVRKGYLEVDFLEDGPLYGWSTNQLLDLARNKRTA